MTQYLDQQFQSTPPYALSGYTPAAERFGNRVAALQADVRVADGWRSSLTLSQAEDRLEQLQSPDYVRTVRPEVDWHNVVTVDRHNRLSFGLRDDRERVDASSYGSYLQQSKTVAYGYLQDEARYGSSHVIAAVNYLHDDVFGERFNWNFEYGYDLSTGTRLIASAGTAFHAPTANDRYGFGGNPDLQPEKAQNYEIGVQQRLGAHQRASLRLFRNDVRDLIEVLAVPGQPYVYLARNVAHSRNEGLQLGWRYADRRWHARVDGIWQDPRNRDSHSLLLRRARLSLSARLTRRLGRFDLGAAFYAAGRRYDIDAVSGAPTTDGGYALLDLLAGARIAHGLRLDLRLDNVLNKHYQSAAGYNQPGSAAYATLRYDLPL